MHSVDVEELEAPEIFIELGLLILEGRKPTSASPKGFEEGPHCLRHLQKTPRNHACTHLSHLCIREESFRKHVEVLWRNSVPLCIEVLLCPDCPCGRDKTVSPEISPLLAESSYLLEQWMVTVDSIKSTAGRASSPVGPTTNGRSILHAVRSFLHFSQLSAWFALSKGESPKNIMYRVTIPGENFVSKFVIDSDQHEFPLVVVKNHVMKVSVKSIPRLGSVPTVVCQNVICSTRSQVNKRSQSPPVGEIIRGGSPRPVGSSSQTRMSMIGCNFRHSTSAPIASSGHNRIKQKKIRQTMAQCHEKRVECLQKKYMGSSPPSSSSESSLSDSDQEISTNSKGHRQLEKKQDGDECEETNEKVSTDLCSTSTECTTFSSNVLRTRLIPTLSEKIDFLKSLDTAASRLFHRKTGLPLTSSPAPLRKGQDRFDFDSSLVSATRSTTRFRRGCHPPRFSEATRALLGPFEESVLNGRIEPVSTVQGFTAEIGASGSFCPRHIHLPVTVFFYTFCDNDKISTPYLAHVDLGEQGYCVPRQGTVQVTLFNPLRTVIKMFVVKFNLENMPNNSQTFLRQRTYFMPLEESDQNPQAQKWLRYLIHLRFASNQSGQIFLHTDIRMVIFRKSDADTATGFVDVQTPHELRSFTYAPHNPKFSPRFNISSFQEKSVQSVKQQQQQPQSSSSIDEKSHCPSPRKLVPRRLIFDEGNRKFDNEDEGEEEEETCGEDEGESDASNESFTDFEFERCKNHSEVEIIV